MKFKENRRHQIKKTATGKKSVKVSAFVITESFTGKKALKDIMVDLLYAEYARNDKRDSA